MVWRHWIWIMIPTCMLLAGFQIQNRTLQYLTWINNRQYTGYFLGSCALGFFPGLFASFTVLYWSTCNRWHELPVLPVDFRSVWWQLGCRMLCASQANVWLQVKGDVVPYTVPKLPTVFWNLYSPTFNQGKVKLVKGATGKLKIFRSSKMESQFRCPEISVLHGGNAVGPGEPNACQPHKFQPCSEHSEKVVGRPEFHFLPPTMWLSRRGQWTWHLRHRHRLFVTLAVEEQAGHWLDSSPCSMHRHVHKIAQMIILMGKLGMQMRLNDTECNWKIFYWDRVWKKTRHFGWLRGRIWHPDTLFLFVLLFFPGCLFWFRLVQSSQLQPILRYDSRKFPWRLLYSNVFCRSKLLNLLGLWFLRLARRFRLAWHCVRKRAVLIQWRSLANLGSDQYGRCCSSPSCLYSTLAAAPPFPYLALDYDDWLPDNWVYEIVVACCCCIILLYCYWQW